MLPALKAAAAVVLWCGGARAVCHNTTAALCRHIYTTAPQQLELQTKVSGDYAKFYNHRESPYCGLLLVESTYLRFQI